MRDGLRKLPDVGGMSGKICRSLLRAMYRYTSNPMTTRPFTSWKPRLEKGTRISANQPDSSCDASAAQKVFQSMFVGDSPSFESSWSIRPPAGFTQNHEAVWWSLYVSSAMHVRSSPA